MTEETTKVDPRLDNAVKTLQRGLFKLYGWHPDYPATQKMVLELTRQTTQSNTEVACQARECTHNNQKEPIPRCQRPRIRLACMNLGDRVYFRCQDYKKA